MTNRITREQARDMEAAHDDGLHDELPREGCPECEGRDLRSYPVAMDARWMRGPIRSARIPKNSCRRGDLREVEAYLPPNYRVAADDDEATYITGRDNAGWTLDGYVIPRLASGLLFAEEVDPRDVPDPDVEAEERHLRASDRRRGTPRGDE